MKTYKNEKGLSFYNLNTKSYQENIWEELKNGLWKELLIDNYLENDSLKAEDLALSKKIFSSIQQIIPGTKWVEQNKRLELDLYYPNYQDNISLKKFLLLCESYFNSLNYKKIGVHLSGGLDSSLIICILKKLGISFIPIGLTSSTFEFRTERRIQEILLSWGEDGCLIDIEDHPFYSEIKTIPKHQIPDDDIKSLSSSRALAFEFKKRGCDVVFSGQGGDSLLVDEVLDFKSLSFNIGNEFMNYSQNDRIYKPLGINLISFFGEKKIIDFLSSARLGHKEDIKKIWMRNWAKEILPKELSEYSYCADFFGLTTYGLMQAKNDIKDLLEEAYDVSHMPHFAPNNIKKFLRKDIFSFEFKDYIRYCGLISIASWYHSFFNNE